MHDDYSDGAAEPHDAGAGRDLCACHFCTGPGLALTSRGTIVTLSFMARLSCMALLALWLIAGTGCETARDEEAQIWKGIKLRDLAPPAGDAPARARFLATVHMDVYVMELPSTNVEQLDDVWDMLSARPIRMNSYNAFSENTFRVRFGRVDLWQQIRSRLIEAGGQSVATTSLVLTDNETSDLAITELPGHHTISFVGMDLSRQRVNVGPGVLVLRLRPEPIPWARGVRKIIAYPTHTLPLTSAIPELQSRARRREFYFASAALAAQMGPGDLLVLGPDEYTGERITLGGLFFSNPEGALFFNPGQGKPPERKPAARVYVLICTSISG